MDGWNGCMCGVRWKGERRPLVGRGQWKNKRIDDFQKSNNPKASKQPSEQLTIHARPDVAPSIALPRSQTPFKGSTRS